jgi:hypothetical protein
VYALLLFKESVVAVSTKTQRFNMISQSFHHLECLIWMETPSFHEMLRMTIWHRPEMHDRVGAT